MVNQKHQGRNRAQRKSWQLGSWQASFSPERKGWEPSPPLLPSPHPSASPCLSQCPLNRSSNRGREWVLSPAANPSHLGALKDGNACMALSPEMPGWLHGWLVQSWRLTKALALSYMFSRFLFYKSFRQGLLKAGLQCVVFLPQPCRGLSHQDWLQRQLFKRNITESYTHPGPPPGAYRAVASVCPLPWVVIRTL